MSELVPSLVPLDKGLNLQTAKLVAPPGSVLDTLNYEQVDFQGQKRIDGFARYDGSILPALDEYHVIIVDGSGYAVGSYMANIDGELIGLVVGGEGSLNAVAIINENLIPAVGDLVYRKDGEDNVDEVVVEEVMVGSAHEEDVDVHYANLLAFSQVIRDQITSLPGQVIGLHWFRDRLYAVADVTTVSLEGTTPTIYPNDLLYLVDENIELKVLDSYTLDNTRVVFLGRYENDYSFDAWQVSGAEVERDSVSVGTIANGFEELLPENEIASFFVALSEEQAYEEDGTPYGFGWKFVDQGWRVNFEDGLSLFGSLPSLNQNITGLGVQGPTSTAGQNGMPLILTQKVDITNGPVQVNGWKSSQTPTTYELETDNFDAVDADTIYADAYISWNGTTGEVVGVTNPLVEYPATNTVIIELP